MRSNVTLWWVLFAFFFLVGVVYTWWNIIAHTGDIVQRIEWVGTVALFFTSFMGILIAFYLHRVHKAQRGELPEDILTAVVDDGEPEQGHFSPWSWWPIVLAGAAGIAILGLAIGTWLMPIGFAIVAVALVGWVYEYYRGYFAR
ncbi:cytochrome c oxidase subunit 4 [Microbacterium sp.]|uniref:cytochrome c oxidase subunit 4 n=1 Tax=Microbacterium sp. TaxID=51671 RepID=UPI0037C71F46